MQEFEAASTVETLPDINQSTGKQRIKAVTFECDKQDLENEKSVLRLPNI